MTTKKIDEIDKNLKVVTSLSEKDIRFLMAAIQMMQAS